VGLVADNDDLPVDAFEHRGKSFDQRADIIVLVECRAMVSCSTNANCRTNGGPEIGSLAEHYDPIHPVLIPGCLAGLTWTASHLWTPPFRQGKTLGSLLRVVGCCHLSGL
jgi:hypothetical protein